jgi:hypothetical protein
MGEVVTSLGVVGRKMGRDWCPGPTQQEAGLAASRRWQKVVILGPSGGWA